MLALLAVSIREFCTLIAFRKHLSIAGILDTTMVDNSERSRSTRVDARRSQRVILRVAILVRAEVEDEPPLKEDTFMQVVNAHGALIALAMKVRPGQNLVLRNWGTAKEKPCRVIHVKDNPFGKKEVGSSSLSRTPISGTSIFPHQIGRLSWNERLGAGWPVPRV